MKEKKWHKRVKTHYQPWSLMARIQDQVADESYWMYYVILLFLFFFFTLYYNLKRKTNEKFTWGKVLFNSIQPKLVPLHFWDNWSSEHKGTWFFIQQTAWRHVEIHDSNIWNASWGKNFLCFLRICGNVFVIGGNQTKYSFLMHFRMKRHYCLVASCWYFISTLSPGRHI